MDLAGLGSQFLGTRTPPRTEGLGTQLSWSTSLGLPVRKERILGGVGVGWCGRTVKSRGLCRKVCLPVRIVLCFLPKQTFVSGEAGPL